MHTLAVRQVFADYEGVAAHAAAAPQPAATPSTPPCSATSNVAALRQHIRPTERIHGVFTEAGDKPNIVPGRGPGPLVRPVRRPRPPSRCSRSGSSAASGPGPTPPAATLVRREDAPRTPTCVDNEPMGDLYVANAARLGRDASRTTGRYAGVVGSTDMGNVSHLVPSIHPMIAVSPPDVPIHSTEFERWAGSAAGDRAVLDGAKALAMTVVDLWLAAGVIEAVRAAFDGAAPSTDPDPPAS